MRICRTAHCKDFSTKKLTFKLSLSFKLQVFFFSVFLFLIRTTNHRLKITKFFPSDVNGIVFFGFPLHPTGKPGIERAEHLKGMKVPMLFLQGTKDELAHWDLLEQVATSLPRATLIKFEGADHAFKKGKENLLPLMAEETAS